MQDINLATMDDMDDMDQDGDKEAEEFRDRLTAIIGRMESEAARRVDLMKPIHTRFLEDLRQYHGLYDEKTASNLTARGKSKLFINLTGPKTNAMIARLFDILHPTDDRNWAIQPTPVPELAENAKEAQEALRKLETKAEGKKKEAERQKAEEGGMDPSLMDEIDTLQEAVDVVHKEVQRITKITNEANARAELMERQIEDQLVESLYHAVCRDQIEDGCKVGTGVVKGPVTGDTVRKGWKPQKDDNGQETNVFSLETSGDNTPAFRAVDIWSFFPDPKARTVEESEGVYERHLFNPKQLRGLAKLSGFDKEAIRRLIKAKSTQAAPDYLANLRSITTTNAQTTGDDLYHVWEYSGCLAAEDMELLAIASGDDELASEYAEIDPLTELNAIVWFCQGEVLKFSVYPYDSGECTYSVFNLFKDEASIFGYGIPWVMRDPQRSLNAAWRAMMDNASGSSGPQVVMAKGQIEPQNGNWNFEGGKIWLVKDGLPPTHRAFDAFNIPSVQNEMGAIIRLSMEFIDLMTAMPAISQGDQGTGVTKTAQGMAMLLNSANVVLKRIVKHYDDDVTTPNIRRAYDWNMQFNPREEIKGDFNVDARGSSVLIVREMQAQNLMVIAIQLGGHPKFAHMFKDRELLRKLLQAHMIPADELLLSDEEIAVVMAEAEAKAAAAQEQATAGKSGGGKDPALAQAELEARDAELAAKVEIANMQAETSRQIAQMNRETAMMKMAETMNMSIDKIEADLEKTRLQIDSKERSIAAEAATIERTGIHAQGFL